MLGKDQDLLKAVVYDYNNRTYGNIVSIYTCTDQPITALIDDGIEELQDILTTLDAPPKTGTTS